LYKNKLKYLEIICDAEMKEGNNVKIFEASENGVMYLY